ncbi:ADP-ribose pyrophosphatase, mitochondrial-like [Diaphorina citri]|uniref:ADP-ribose pyrophosphatase, mitochondrial-like n=1 Tax=Diaphorina citri TaxID=121845 RepID=A0A1S3D5L3_DIACI|nr:ADP-ribose pyrophosphatase, mitochondrial-like [Diaphorina citri]
MRYSRSYLSVIFFFCLPKLNWTILLFNTPYESGYMVDRNFGEFYPRSNVTRLKLPKEKYYVWEFALRSYNPEYFVHPSVIGQPWADSENVNKYVNKFNELDGYIDRRRCCNVKYELDYNTGRPLNPSGRTGICGRGLLGRWGPNHSAFLIVTRWFRDHNGDKVTMPSSGKPLLEFVTVKFNGEWGIPGGFIEGKETYMDRGRKEFLEEALNASNMTAKESKSILKHLETVMDDNCHFVYRGYMKDERNTDNAWVEGAVTTVHDKKGEHFMALPLSPGDGAEDVKWLIVHSDMTFNPTHKTFMKVVTDIHGAHW